MPAMNVKPNTATTPQPLLRSADTMNSDPIIAANISSGAMIGEVRKNAAKLIAMPTYAPAIVGSIDIASSQYVLRNTLFGAATTTWSADCAGMVQRDCGSIRTGSSSLAMVFPLADESRPCEGS